MGRPKALLEYRGETFAGRLVRVLSTLCDPVIVVLGYHADEIQARVGATVVVNRDPDRGQLSSLQTALRAVPDDIEGFLFIPVDCPTVADETIAELFRAFFGGNGSAIVIPRYQVFGDGQATEERSAVPLKRRGHPVIVPGALIAEFLALDPTEETRTVINRHSREITYVDVDDPGILADIDDPEAYRALAQ
jgi:molybdenum cofactor cytidylyltransferase